MSYKFMKITRVVIPFMTLVILTSQLTGCASLNPSELIDETDKSQEVELLIPTLDTDKIGNSSVVIIKIPTLFSDIPGQQFFLIFD